MIDFHSFETFDPHGPGLGNLFGQVSPFEALGIWPSGDFRLAPGDGAVPAFGYYLGAAFAALLLVYGLVLCWRRRETAIVAGLLAAALAYAAARVGGTPYTAAKAIEIAAPLAALSILLPLLRPTRRGPSTLLAAGGCSLLALANAPVGPTSYTPALTGLRPLVASGSTVVLASHELLADQHGAPYIAWELRGGRVCIETDAEAGGAPPPGVRFVVAEGSPGQAALPRPARAPRRRALRALGTSRPRPRPQPLPADRRSPGAPGPSPLSAATGRLLVAVGSMGRIEAATEKITVKLPDGTPLELPAEAPPGRTPPRRSAPAWRRRRWRSASTASCATSRRRCPTAPRSRSSPTATPRRWS